MKTLVVVVVVTFLLAGFSVMGNAAVSTVPSQEEHPELFSTGNCQFSELLLRGRTDLGIDSTNSLTNAPQRDFVMGLSGNAEVLFIDLGGTFLKRLTNWTDCLLAPFFVAFDQSGKELWLSSAGWNFDVDTRTINNPAYLKEMYAAFKLTGAPQPPLCIPYSVESYDSGIIKNVSGNTTVQSVTAIFGGSGINLFGAYLMSGTITGFSAQAYEDRVGVPDSTLVMGFDIIGPKVAAGKPLPTKTVFVECQSSTLPKTLPEHMPHPVIRVYDSKDNLLATNGGWSSVVTVSAYATAHGYHIRRVTTADCKTVGATQPAGVDCALVMTASPGGYTVVVTDGTNKPGNSLTRIINGDKLPM